MPFGLAILANDLSAVQPTWVPPNVKFEIDDMESPWLYDNPFDFIFCRYMAACIKDWPKLVQSIFENLTPGGWAEFQDFDLQYYSEDGSLTESHDTMKWINTLLGAARKIGRDPCPGVSLEKWVKEAGFKNVTHHRFRFPIGPWPRDPKMKEIGMYNLTQVLQGLEGFSLRLFCDVLGWRQEEVVVLTSKVRKELKTRSFHAQYDLSPLYSIAYDEVVRRTCSALDIPFNGSRLLATQKWTKLTVLVFDIFYDNYVPTAHYKVNLPVLLVDYGRTQSYVRVASPEFREAINDHLATQHNYHGWDGKPHHFEDQTSAAAPKYENPRDTSVL
ncbi:hypothetical protein DL770_008972 [Monosporascus sp. CRB-9-2]|nr:hypothetical protein DL770_008972 [Monosporascus sp. CRB-9-2]